jgi:hypothetical protein
MNYFAAGRGLNNEYDHQYADQCPDQRIGQHAYQSTMIVPFNISQTQQEVAREKKQTDQIAHLHLV